MVGRHRTIFASCVQVVTAQMTGQDAPGRELFVRLRLGNATQFTQPRPTTTQPVAWHQDFVFVGVPTRPGAEGAEVSVHPLGIEVCCVPSPLRTRF